MIPPNARQKERHFHSYYAHRPFFDFPHIKEIKQLWCNSWYDGELEGVAEANGEKLYYYYHDEDTDGSIGCRRGRIFLLYRLDDAQLEAELALHEKEEKPYSSCGYYDADERNYSFSADQIVGFCTDCDW